jgi:hypothetical protein
MRDNNYGSSGRRRGFSLIAALLIAMVGMSLIGGVMYSLESFSGRSRVVLSDTVINNVLEDAIEKGKAALKARMDNEDPPPRWWMNKPSLDKDSSIPSVETLVLKDGTMLLSPDLPGKTGNIKVEIFDMQYEPDKIEIADAKKIELVPHSLKLKEPNPYINEEIDYVDEGAAPLNVGAYLIRATLEIEDGANTEVKILETAVVQANLIEK